ncbi:hypothetical protein ZWY2020_029182 [Hordeum vulgare]|nr:hypothetical protein ZWY2020_029182 [Hordeum vulgare]
MESSSTAAASTRHAEGGAAEGEYEEVLVRLSSLIMQKVREHTGNHGNLWDLMHRYLQILEMEEPIGRMKVIHVASTKGKASTSSTWARHGRSSSLRRGLARSSARLLPFRAAACWIVAASSGCFAVD